jgi:hypothetical protein
VAAPSKNSIWRVLFLNEGKLFEVYARSVAQADLFGFIEIEGLLFGEKSAIVVDPGEEKLRNEFAGVSRTLIPLHSVVRIDSVEKRGTPRILPAGEAAKVTSLPLSVVAPGKRES